MSEHNPPGTPDQRADGQRSAPYSQPPAYGQPAPFGQPPAPYGLPAPDSQPPDSAQPPGYGQQHGQSSYGQMGRGRGSRRWEPQPGGIPLRPLTFGEILNGAFTSVQRNRSATLGLSAILLTCSGVISAVLTLVGHTSAGPALSTSGEPITTVLQASIQVTLPVQLTLDGLAILVEILLIGLLTTAIGRGVLGHKVSIGQVWRIALPRLPALLGLTLLSTVIILCPIAAVVVLNHVLATGNANPAAAITGLGSLGAAILVVWLAVMFSLAAPVVMLERRNPGHAIGRSWRLVWRSFWRLLGIFVLTLLIVFVAAVVLEIPFTLIAAAVGGNGLITTSGAATLSPATLIIETVGSIVAGTVTRPIAAGVIVLLYLDTRMRKEGLDLDLQNVTAGGKLTGDELETVWRAPAPGDPARIRAASPW